MPIAFNNDLGLEVAFKEGYNTAKREQLAKLKEV